MQDKQIGRDYPGTHDGRCTIKARIALEILRGIPQGGVVDWRTAVTSKKLRRLSLSCKVAWHSAVWRWIQRKPKSSIAKIESAKVHIRNVKFDFLGYCFRPRLLRPKVPRHQPGADCSVLARNRGNARGAKGAGHPRRDLPESTGNRRNSLIATEGGSLQWVARAG